MRTSQSHAVSRKVQFENVCKLATKVADVPDGVRPLSRSQCERLAAQRTGIRLALFGLMLACQLPGRARAEDLLEIPASCGSQTELDREVAALRATDHTQPPPPRPAVRLTQQSDAYVLDIELPDARRTLRDSDCRALFRAAIVIAALGHQTPSVALVDTAGEPKPPQQAPAKPASAALKPPPQRTLKRTLKLPISKPRPAPADRSVAGDARQPAPPIHARALLDAGFSYGLVPALSAALQAGLAVERGRWGARLVGGYHTPRSHHDGSEGVRVDAVSVSLTLELAATAWLRPGLGVDLQLLHGRGLGVSEPQSAWTSQVALHASLSFRLLTWGRLSLDLGLRGLWAPQPSRFLIRGRAPIYTASKLGFQAGLALGLQFL